MVLFYLGGRRGGEEEKRGDGICFFVVVCFCFGERKEKGGGVKNRPSNMIFKLMSGQRMNKDGEFAMIQHKVRQSLVLRRRINEFE